MRRIAWYLVLMVAFTARPSSAIQLGWSSGGTNLNFSSATRCTLLIQAEPPEGRLPSEWRLLWVSDSLSL